MSDTAQVIYIVLIIDCVISIVVGGSVLLNAEYFEDRVTEQTRRFMTPMILASGSIFLLCTLFFVIVHMWAWAPFNVAETIVPFNVTWKSAITLACFATIGWALPLKRAIKKYEKADSQ